MNKWITNKYHRRLAKMLRKWLKCMTISFFAIVVFILYVCFSRLRTQGKMIKLGPDCINGELHDYYSVKNDDDMIDTVKWVCIKSQDDPVFVYTKHETGRYSAWHIGDSVYELPALTCNLPSKHLITHDNSYIFRGLLGFHGYNLVSSYSQIPRDCTISNETAFFLGRNDLPFEPENLFHFFKQIFIPLYYMMTSTGNLNPRSKNVLFYDRPLGRCPSIFKQFNVDQNKPFYDLLKITDPYMSVHEEILKPDNICYKTAYFSSSRHLNHAIGAIEYVKTSFGVSSLRCHSTSKLVTFIARKTYRRIINREELVRVAESMGYETKVAYFEDMMLLEQAQLIHCTDILVGVAGAGIQWAYFLRNYSGVVEIAWPHHQWPFFFSSTIRTGPSDSRYSEMNGIRPLSFAQLRANECHFNPEAVNLYHYSLYKVRSNFTREEALKILSDKRNNDYSKDNTASTGKLCDVDVNPEKFKEALMKIRKCESKIGPEWS